MSKSDFENIRDSLCNFEYVMVGCKLISSDKITVLAWAPHEDVFEPTETSKCEEGVVGVGRVSQGTKWYMHDNNHIYDRGVFGFADGQSELDLWCVDVSTTQPEKRLSWWWDWDAVPTLGGYRYVMIRTKTTCSPMFHKVFVFRCGEQLYTGEGHLWELIFWRPI